MPARYLLVIDDLLELNEMSMLQDKYNFFSLFKYKFMGQMVNLFIKRNN